MRPVKLFVVIVLLLGLLLPQRVMAQQDKSQSQLPADSLPKVALRNNLLYDATLSPNLGIDLRVSWKMTVGLLAGFNAWDIDKEKNKKWRHMLFLYARADTMIPFSIKAISRAISSTATLMWVTPKFPLVSTRQ